MFDFETSHNFLGCQIGTQKPRKRACSAAMEARKRTGSTKILLDSTTPKKRTHSEKLHEQSRARTRVILGVAFERWRQL